MPQANHHNVPTKMWRRWSDVGQFVFNETFETMRSNANLFKHPKDPVQKPVEDHWTTTCWNAAWTAADAATRGQKDAK